MRDRWYRLFWTELGRRLLGGGEPLPEGLPSRMSSVLRSSLAKPERGSVLVEEMLTSREARSIYGRTWKLLRDMGYSRPLRLDPWPGINLLLPFHRDLTAVVPQSFSSRVPEKERALSLVGRNAAAALEGYRMVVVMARWSREVLEVLEAGGVSACSLDMVTTMCGRGSPPPSPGP